MTRVSFAPMALSDLREIERFTAERWGEQQAVRYIAALLQAAENAANGLSAARPMPHNPEIFRLRVQSHLLFFRRLREGRIKLLRIRHASMGDVDL